MNVYDTWLVGTKCTRDFPAREMVIFRRQELIIRLCHPFRSLNVDPHGSSYGVDSRHQSNRQCCSSLPVRHQRIYTLWRCGEHRVFIIRDEFRFGSFRRFLTVGLFHFRRECICRCDSGRGGENSLPLLIRCRRPIGSPELNFPGWQSASLRYLSTGCYWHQSP